MPMKVSEKAVDLLLKNRNISDQELITLLETTAYDNSLFSAADDIRKQIYGDKVYILAGDLAQSLNEQLQSLGFDYVTLDLGGYKTGSMNKTMK